MAREYAARRYHSAADWGGWIGWIAFAGLAAGVFGLPALNLPPGVTMGSTDTRTGMFGLCHRGGGYGCVVDGDTFWYEGMKVRIADIDTPETHPARCDREAIMGSRATARLQQLLNAGAFSLVSIDRDTDRYGRKLRIVRRDGQSIGNTLVAEGLARPYAGGHRDGWCHPKDLTHSVIA